jgi:catechol 2,3-dioxygenase-like lactoylglutathione lyase family enzyme
MGASSARLIGIAIDCADAAPVAHFYERLLGYRVLEVGPRWAQLEDPVSGLHLNIQAEPWYEPPEWPEVAGSMAKMLHLEVEVDELGGAVTRALEAGGREARWQPPDRDRERIRIILDPAGHPLCLFLPGE